MAQKKSFLARLTGMMEQEEDLEEEIAGASEEPTDKETSELQIRDDEELSDDGESGEGELAVDVFQKPTEIVVKAMVAGVKPEDLDVALTREMVTIKGKR